jgi:small subunit ribosomal protein S5
MAKDRTEPAGAKRAEGTVPEDFLELEERVVDIYRSAKVMKGGRKFRFGALVVVGDKFGRVGYGYGKAREVPQAIEKAMKTAKRSMVRFPLVSGTIPHEVRGRYGGGDVVLLPAGPGTGVIAGSVIKAVAECMGVSNLLSKSFGSANSKNILKATFQAMGKLRTREQVASLRGVDAQ